MPVTLPPNVYAHNAAGFEGFRVVFRRNGKVTQRYFSTKKYGSKKSALAAAVEYADAERHEAHARRYVHKGAGRGRAGIRGVMQVNESWMAHWYDPPQHRVRVYCGTGSDGQKLAKKIRREAEQLIKEGKPTQHLLTKYK
jgi:hypothetical protein